MARESDNGETMRSLRNISILFFVVWFAIYFESASFAFQQPQGTFELKVPGMNVSSIASLRDTELTIRDSSGKQTNYQRNPRYDTPDQQWIAFSSREAQQVIRWPRSNTGSMQIGTLQQGQIQFTPSKMLIQSLGNSGSGRGELILPPGNTNRPLSPSDAFAINPIPNATIGQSNAGPLGLPTMTPLHLGIGPGGSRQYLSFGAGNTFGLLNGASDVSSAWYVAPAGNDMVRIQQRALDGWQAIGLSTGQSDMDWNAWRRQRMRSPSRPGMGSFGTGSNSFTGARGPMGNLALGMYPLGGGSDQLWRIVPYAGGYCFENVLLPGYGLTCSGNGALFLKPIVYDPWQIWFPLQPVMSLPVPQYRTVQQQFVANPPLPPINITLLNTHQDELLILFADHRNSRNPTKIRIPVGKGEPIQIQRDAGGSIVETVEIADALGNWSQQQYTTPVPPSVLYDLSVYEIFLQSIAIDRTGKSPNPVEDTNYQPRSIGYFLIPPGSEMQPDMVIDVYQTAVEAGNAGAVRRLNERDLKGDANSNTKDPLKELLQQFQSQRAAF
jgi:hypothetical protein